MTTAECAARSLSNKFIELLASALSYSFEGDTLRINLLVDGGAITSVPAVMTVQARSWCSCWTKEPS